MDELTEAKFFNPHKLSLSSRDFFACRSTNYLFFVQAK